jgi:hypothetical protein
LPLRTLRCYSCAEGGAYSMGIGSLGSSSPLMNSSIWLQKSQRTGRNRNTARPSLSH